ncbi:MAG: glycosyltransferase N-terminal domain-containing protein [Pseudomonadota bacterium]
MRLGLFLYKFATLLVSAVLPLILRRRVAKGKETTARLPERYARNLPGRPDGLLVWLHAASVGESRIAAALAIELLGHKSAAQDSSSGVAILITCQTLTGYDTLQNVLGKDHATSDKVLIAAAPIDTPQIARRFVDHWRPDLAVFVEGEIWPNLLQNLHRIGARTALINGRMTDQSIGNWLRWPRTAKTLFGRFDLLQAADKRTATGLEALSGKTVEQPGNLKTALSLPPPDPQMMTDLLQRIGKRTIWLAASTHPGEEALVLDALMQMQAPPFCIIAPRHPERGDQVEALLSMSRLAYARRSVQGKITPETNIYLADTLGEMALWYEISDVVYLGGGHAPGVGGHNSLEPLKAGKPVMTGPSLFNFEDMVTDLKADPGFVIVEDAAAMVTALNMPPPSPALLDRLEANALSPLRRAVTALSDLLNTTERAK